MDVKTKVAILLGAPLTPQNLERICAETLAQKFEIIIIDCLSWIYPKSINTSFEKAEWDQCKQINSIEEFKEYFEQNKITFALDFIGEFPERAQIAKILKRSGTCLVVQKLGLLPHQINPWMRLIYNREISASNSIKKYLDLTGEPTMKQSDRSILIKRLFNRITRIFLNPFILRLNNPYIVLQTGHRFSSWSSIFARKVIRIASNDYHQFNSTEICTGVDTPDFTNTAVFVDDCLTESLDWQIMGTEAPINKDAYFKAINSLFDRIESQFNVKVVIAGHPNTHENLSYERKFMGRHVLYSNTSTLVKDADFVLIHTSTAVSFAVLARKPIITMTSDDIIKTNIGRGVKAMTFSLGTTLLNIDFPPDQISMARVNASKYRRYTHRYLKSSRVFENARMENFVKYANTH